MELKEKIALMLKAALEYNSSIVAQASLIYSQPNQDRKFYRKQVLHMRKTQQQYMKQLDHILNQLEEEVEVS